MQSKAREIYDLGVKSIGASKSQIAQMKAQLTAITNTVTATGNKATDYVNELENALKRK